MIIWFILACLFFNWLKFIFNLAIKCAHLFLQDIHCRNYRLRRLIIHYQNFFLFFFIIFILICSLDFTIKFFLFERSLLFWICICLWVIWFNHFTIVVNTIYLHSTSRIPTCLTNFSNFFLDLITVSSIKAYIIFL